MAVKAAKKATKKPVKKAVRPVPKKIAVVRKSEDLPHRLDTLLHTMRCIAQHEDELCTLLHDARRTGRLNAALLRELRSVLEELPAGEYLDDLHAVQQAIQAV